MRIPVLIESKGPCVSSWVHRRGLRRIRVSGLDGVGVVVISDCGREAYFGSDGEHELPWDTGKQVKVKHFDKVTVSVDLVV